MSTRSKNGSAPKGKKTWNASDITAWMIARLGEDLPVALSMPANLTELHKHLRRLHHDPTPLPLHPEHLPLLP